MTVPEHHTTIIELLVLVAASFAAPLLSGLVHVPSSVLLILLGVLVGPHALGIVGVNEVPLFLAEVGFIVLMFLAGLEIDFNQIRHRGLGSLLLMTGICVGIGAVAVIAVLLLGLAPAHALALGAMSVGLPLAILKEGGGVRGRLGQTIILVGSVGELLTIIGMTLYYFLARYGVSIELVTGLARMLAVFILAGLVLRTLAAAAWWWPDRFAKMVAEEDGSELGVRASLLLMVVFSTVALLADVESIVGAFMAGAVIAFVLRGKRVLEEKLSVVGHGFFVPIFFLMVGVKFEPTVVTGEALGFALELLALSFVVKMLPGFFLLREGLSLRETVSASVLLSAPLTLVVAIAGVGEEVGALDQTGTGTLVLLAILSGVVFPVVFRLINRSAP